MPKASVAGTGSAEEVQAVLPFASLTPVNALSKMAFSDVFEAMALQQKTQSGRPHLRMEVEDEQHYDADVARFLIDEERGRETSESLTEPDTDTEARGDSSVGMIWTGRYVFAFRPVPSSASSGLGWTAGRGTTDHDSCGDLILSTRAFARRYSIPLRTFHARFDFAQDTAAFFVARGTRSPHAELTVNGSPVERHPHTLNQYSMRIRVSLLEYLFEYTEFAATDTFLRLRRGHISRHLGGLSATPFDMPTPMHETRTMGQWTLAGPLGKGAEGRVFVASNARNEVVAIKVIERRSRTADRINAEIKVFRQLTDLSRSDDADDGDGKRLARLKEIIFPGGREAFLPGSAFDQVGVVIEPMAPATLASVVVNAVGVGRKGMSLQSAIFFRDALRGLRFLHAHGWVHRDIKPQNIGVLTHPPRAALLDFGNTQELPLGASLTATPGRAGTVNYLSPEREMDRYDHGADVWPMAVIGYELTYGAHPFQFSKNPWRPGSDYERLRSSWEQKYKKAIALLSADHQQWLAEQRPHRDPDDVHCE